MIGQRLYGRSVLDISRCLSLCPQKFHKFLSVKLLQIRVEIPRSNHLAKLQRRGCESVYLLLCVDDLLLAGRDDSMINLLKKALLSAFEGTDKGEIHHFLGMTFHRHRRLCTLYIDETEVVVKDLLDKTSMQEANGKYIPMQKDEKRKQEEPPYGPADRSRSCQLQELLYVSTTSKPDIAYAVGKLSRHMKAPEGCHLDQAKYLLRYLITTQDFGLRLGGSEGADDLIGYVDPKDFATGLTHYN
jgi:hypothetical protein